jgi:hypothetical protein
VTRRAPTVALLQEALNQYHAQESALRTLDAIAEARGRSNVSAAGPHTPPPPLMVTVAFEGGDVQVELHALREAVRKGRDAVREELTRLGVGEVAV